MKASQLLLPSAGLGVAAASSCCLALNKAPELQGKVVFPDTELYDARIASYWSVSAALPPWCMVLPLTAEDVSAIIKTLVAGDCPFGIRGGGHSAHRLSNSVEDGVTIDFGYMNTTTYDAATNIASVPPGSNWQSVYDTLAPHGVVVAGGRAGTVGTGGFLAGGGNSFHSASHGMACDTVANYQVVLADGAVVDANASSNADLFRALKGGGGNLGLVTRFDMRAIPYADPADPVIWGGNLFYELDAGPALVDAFVDFADNVHKDEDSSSIMYWIYLPTVLDDTIINVAIDNTLAAVKPPAFDGYYAVEGLYQDTTTVATMSTVANELGSGSPPGFRNIWFTTSFKNDARPVNYAVEKYTALNAALELVAPSNQTGLNSLCMFQPITQSIAAKGAAAGGNVMGLEELTADGNAIMVLLGFALNGAEAEARVLPLIEAYMADVEGYAEELGVAGGWRYMNYAYGSQDPVATFGEEAVELLWAASDKYDPEGVFQKLRASGHKLPKRS